jgi:predicted nuclease of predicted toxin-antitoxin system
MGHPPKISWIRTGNLTTAEIAEILYQRKIDIEHFLYNEAYSDLSCIEIE